MAPRPSPMTWSVVIGVGAIALYALLPLRGEFAALGLILMVAVIVAAFPVMRRTLHRVNRSDRPVAEAVVFLFAMGSVAIMLPAAIYVAVADISPGSFDGLETKIDGVYFTVVVLSTVGFGDIHPASQGARLLTTGHILASVILLGGSIRLLTKVVGLRVDQWQDDKD